MKTIRTKVGIMIIASLVLFSCKENQDQDRTDHSNMDHGNMSENSEMVERANASEGGTAAESENARVGNIVQNYLQVKDALVSDNQEEAASAGGRLVAAFEVFDIKGTESGQQQEMIDIIEDAKEHAEHIAESDIVHQREHFHILSKDVRDMLAITGTDRNLYQQYCPMYNNNKGAIWLSESKEVRNPYYGQKMLKCGEVQEEITK